MPYFLAPLWKINPENLEPDALWEHYDMCLRAYDWSFAMSDDNGVFRAGEEQRTHLLEVQDLLMASDVGRAQQMYNEACPWINDDGTRIDFED